MAPGIYPITLIGDRHYGRRLPPEALGPAIIQIPAIVRASISMAFRGQSAIRGVRPRWLKAASDIRFLAHSGEDETTLQFEVPKLGEAAPELFPQQEFWSRGPAPEDTGFDLFGDVLTDIAKHDEDSERFDPQLLSRLVRFRNVLNGTFRELAVTGRRYTPEHPARLGADTIQTAERFYLTTPAPQRVRVVGILDMIRASTQAFALRLDDGQEVRGVLSMGRIEELAPLFRRRVLVLGKAVFRASGRLLRIDAESVAHEESTSSLWSRVPSPRKATLDPSTLRRSQSRRSGVAAILGRWPGDETDDEIQAALETVS